VRTTRPGKPRRTGAPDGTEEWSSKPGQKTSAENARGHAEQHRGEFGFSEREYIDTAKKFVSDPPSTAEVFVRESGEVMIYDPPTKTFAIRTPEGVPATMYKADMAYWEGQLAEYGGRRVGR
jgi:pyocin large subunit-like protein